MESTPKIGKVVSDPISFFTIYNHLIFLSDIDFNPMDVKKAMLDVSTSAAPVPDYFPALPY